MRVEYRGDLSNSPFFIQNAAGIGEEPERADDGLDLCLQHEDAVRVLYRIALHGSSAVPASSMLIRTIFATRSAFSRQLDVDAAGDGDRPRARAVVLLPRLVRDPLHVAGFVVERSRCRSPCRAS